MPSLNYLVQEQKTEALCRKFDFLNSEQRKERMTGVLTLVKLRMLLDQARENPLALFELVL
jgi:hypothetical protein